VRGGHLGDMHILEFAEHSGHDPHASMLKTMHLQVEPQTPTNCGLVKDAECDT